MLIALILMILAAAWGWRLAARRGGNTPDKLQYAAAYGVAAFLMGMVGMTIAVNMGFGVN